MPLRWPGRSKKAPRGAERRAVLGENGLGRGRNNIATEIPNYEQVIPKLPGEMGRKELLAEFKGIMGNRDGDLHVIYQNKKGVIAGFNSGYVKMLKGYFPNSEIYITAPDEPAMFVVDGEVKRTGTCDYALHVLKLRKSGKIK